MKSYIRTLLIDGVLFLIPLVLVLYLLRLIFNIIREIIEPISKVLPDTSFFGHGLTDLAALLILFVLVLLSGYISRSYFGDILSKSVGAVVSKIVPGFSILKKLFYDQKDIYDSQEIKPALALIDDAWLFSFILEEKNDADLFAVFVPSAPVPTSGNLYLMKEEQLKLLDISIKDTVRLITQLGIGSKEILKGKIH